MTSIYDGFNNRVVKIWYRESRSQSTNIPSCISIKCEDISLIYTMFTVLPRITLQDKTWQYVDESKYSLFDSVELLSGPVGQIVCKEKDVLVVEKNKLLIPPQWNTYFCWGSYDQTCSFGNYAAEKVSFPTSFRFICISIHVTFNCCVTVRFLTFFKFWLAVKVWCLYSLCFRALVCVRACQIGGRLCVLPAPTATPSSRPGRALWCVCGTSPSPKTNSNTWDSDRSGIKRHDWLYQLLFI